ncbi:MAG: alpha-mannosidase, partial [Chloroflexota bacterium]
MHHKIRWTEEKIAQRLALVEGQVYIAFHPIDPFTATKLPSPDPGPVIKPDPADDGWFEIPTNSYWGEWMTDYLLRSSFSVPADWTKDQPVALFLPIGEAGDFSHPEALVHIDGRPIAGCDRYHQEIFLDPKWCDGASHELELHTWTGLQALFDKDYSRKLLMRPCGVVQIDQPTRDFVATARVALGVVAELDDNNRAKSLLLNALDDAFKLIDIREPIGPALYESIPDAHAKLKSGIESAGHSLDVDIVGVGHAHIDVAWLWTLGQTRRKSGRTFHTVLRLMEQFPDYKFTQSQPQLYEYLGEDYPELLESIKQRVAEGRWEATGGMWVEADCNLSGAESLARQFLIGRNYFEALFGKDVDTPIMWLPDVFGYAWNLPQLIKQAGLDYFFTIKISWNQYNRLPYDSFWWQGLDGTKVLTHFSTTQDAWSAARGKLGASTYNANATPLQAHSTWNNSQQKEAQQEFLMAFGYGDGGGGPTREMLENIREMNNFPATPRMRHGKAIDFFKNLEASAGDKLPTWNGELYFEYHRGTYTTQARNKRANRKSE